MQFSPVQSAAIDAVAGWFYYASAERPVFRIWGFAGTGKTTLARHFADQVDGRVHYAAFTGFQALPAPNAKRSWLEVMEFLPGDRIQITAAVIEARFRSLAKSRHPDKPGGSSEKMSELNRARDEALKEIGL